MSKYLIHIIKLGSLKNPITSLALFWCQCKKIDSFLKLQLILRTNIIDLLAHIIEKVIEEAEVVQSPSLKLEEERTKKKISRRTYPMEEKFSRGRLDL